MAIKEDFESDATTAVESVSSAGPEPFEMQPCSGPSNTIFERDLPPRADAESQSLTGSDNDIPTRKIVYVLCRDKSIAGMEGLSLRGEGQEDEEKISQVTILAAYRQEELAREYVDNFIKRYCDDDHGNFADITAIEHDRERYLHRIKENPVPVKKSRGEVVKDEEGSDRVGYEVYDERNERMRTVWVDAWSDNNA